MRGSRATIAVNAPPEIVFIWKERAWFKDDWASMASSYRLSTELNDLQKGLEVNHLLGGVEQGWQHTQGEPDHVSQEGRVQYVVEKATTRGVPECAVLELRPVAFCEYVASLVFNVTVSFDNVSSRARCSASSMVRYAQYGTC